MNRALYQYTKMAGYTAVSFSVLLSVTCLGLAMVFVGGWYFQSSLIELKAQQQETVKVVQLLKERLKKQNKQLIVLQLQLEKVRLYICYIVS